MPVVFLGAYYKQNVSKLQAFSKAGHAACMLKLRIIKM